MGLIMLDRTVVRTERIETFYRLGDATIVELSTADGRKSTDDIYLQDEDRRWWNLLNSLCYAPASITVRLRPEVAERLDQLTDGAAAAVLADYARRIVTGEIVPEDYRNIVAENATTTEG